MVLVVVVHLARSKQNTDAFFSGSEAYRLTLDTFKRYIAKAASGREPEVLNVGCFYVGNFCTILFIFNLTFKLECKR